MAAPQNFRTAFNGFNREDVVHYLEYINTKHTTQVNQLTSENEELRSQLEQCPQEDCREQIDALEARWAELDKRDAEKAAAKEAKLKAKERERKRKALEDAARQAEKDAQTLEKYRRKFEEQKANEAAKASGRKAQNK